MEPIRIVTWLLAVIVVSAPIAAGAGTAGFAGAHAGAGTDVSGGIAYGAQIEYVFPKASNAFELALAVFGGEFTEESEEGIYRYEETTNLLAIGVLANMLFNYSTDARGPYIVAGAGVGSIGVEWEERSPNDVSLGPLLPGGGSMQSEDASAAGLILNVGLGWRVGSRFDVRAQAPTFFISETEERDAKTVPTITLMLGMRF